jgi:hypothetical protein
LEEFMAIEKTERQKAKSKGFAVLGVPIGAILTFRKDSAITCTVVDDRNKVEYRGKIYPISGLAKELMKTPVSGYHAFKYNGVLLAKLGDPAGKPAEQAADSPPAFVQPASGASVASGQAVPPESRTIPLPKSQTEMEIN